MAPELNDIWRNGWLLGLYKSTPLTIAGLTLTASYIYFNSDKKLHYIAPLSASLYEPLYANVLKNGYTHGLFTANAKDPRVAVTAAIVTAIYTEPFLKRFL